MKTRGVCTKCQHNELLAIDSVADTGHGGTLGPLHIAIAFAGAEPWGHKTKVAGRLNALVCARCGYTELYVVDPGAIPVDGVYVRRLVGPDQTNPYR